MFLVLLIYDLESVRPFFMSSTGLIGQLMLRLPFLERIKMKGKLGICRFLIVRIRRVRAHTDSL